MKKIIFTLIIFLSCITTLLAIPAEVENVSGNLYFDEVLGLIQNAKESIYVGMYIINLDKNNEKSVGKIFCDALVTAKKRGVEVKVVLDYKGERSEPNIKPYYYLKKKDIPVFWDSPHKTLHSKVIIIDKKTVVIGSANWSPTSLYYNEEHSVIIQSKELAQEITRDLKKYFIKEEIKPLIEATIRTEFNKILDEAETAKPTKTLMVDSAIPQRTSLMKLVDEEEEEDSIRAGINDRIFKGKTLFTEEKTPFAGILNQTVKEVETQTGIYANPLKQGGGQIKVTLPSSPPMVENTTPNATKTLSRKDLMAKMGLEDIGKIGGNVEGMPGAEGKTKNVLHKIVAQDSTPTQLTEVELPMMSAGGEDGAPKPINYNNVPMELVQNMMKDYRGLLKKVDLKVHRPE